MASQQNEPLRLTPHDDTSSTTAEETRPPFSSPRALLQYLYQDVTRFGGIASENCALHPADRTLPPCLGVAACQQHEEQLVQSTRGTLRMVVEIITVDSRNEFGCVMGLLELGGGVVREGFCGVWRFESWADGNGIRRVRAVEHWENLTTEGGGG
ncbi:hypothetical protein B0T21DRAFT_351675 [Apiosordaria backusii]|uniref:Uncharacterized protein n=1 Tax=Apiosordaria backusii TaxID=314023 RepID=A0AA40E165_9PEZI|nr:hypothetical protein B0T21DRAFT_351675 [Apiosordaria backusii]